MTGKWVLACISISIAAPAFAQTGNAVSPAQFYAGKKINFIVGAAPGGGYGRYAELLARHLGPHIPGKPEVVVNLMPGAGSLTAANALYSASAHDGSVIGAVFMGAVVEPLISDRNKARYDSRKFGYIGSANRESAICVARKSVGVNSWTDLFKKQLIVGAAGWTSSIRQYPAVLQKILGMKFKVITGYPGSREATNALDKGETQGLCGIQWSSFEPSYGKWIKDGKVVAFGQISPQPGNSALNAMGVKNIWPYVKDAKKKKVLELIFDQMEFGRPYITPPGVPKDRLAALRTAFDATMADPAFLADAKKQRLPINPMTGAEVQAKVDALYTVPSNLVDIARKALK